jgi:hypothetical protein
MTDFVFKDRLFASLSNYAAVVCSHEQGGILGAGGVAPANPLGQVTMWQDVESRARVQLEVVDGRVESGEPEGYDMFEEETIQKVGHKLDTVLKTQLFNVTNN